VPGLPVFQSAGNVTLASPLVDVIHVMDYLGRHPYRQLRGLASHYHGSHSMFWVLTVVGECSSDDTFSFCFR